MRIVPLIAVLVVAFSSNLIAIVKDKPDSIFERTEETRKRSDPGWNLARKEAVKDGATYWWASSNQVVSVYISVAASQGAASELLDQLKMRITTATKPLTELGDEAVLSKGEKVEACVVIIRKSNVVVQINGPSLGVSKKWARMILDQIKE